jgi:hypothetical protein
MMPAPAESSLDAAAPVSPVSAVLGLDVQDLLRMGISEPRLYPAAPLRAQLGNPLTGSVALSIPFLFSSSHEDAYSLQAPSLKIDSADDDGGTMFLRELSNETLKFLTNPGLTSFQHATSTV